MQRVVVFGTTGSGKSWLAGRLAECTGLRIVELDQLYWARDWQPAPFELFRHRIECELKDGGWIVVGIYGQVRDLTWGPADTLIWLDLPFPLVLWRLLRRTIRRIATRENLWGTGNYESLGRTFLSRQSILLWAMKTHRRNRRRFTEECARFAGHKNIVHLRSAGEVERFMAGHGAAFDHVGSRAASLQRRAP
ncbi:MAG: adenylate kinase [Alphaproteobacteria bacterium]|nr:adenylate kinase [Alphaproteobacteria bacterium]